VHIRKRHWKALGINSIDIYSLLPQKGNLRRALEMRTVPVTPPQGVEESFDAGFVSPKRLSLTY
jgi:hypothetical protein